MQKNRHPKKYGAKQMRGMMRRYGQAILIGAACIASSFAVGIQTAGDVHPISLIEAGAADMRGDMDGNGFVDNDDVKIILEIAQGYREATPQQLQADPNGNGILTVEDAIRVLQEIRR